MGGAAPPQQRFAVALTFDIAVTVAFGLGGAAQRWQMRATQTG
jgi:hypothetical protein